MGDLVSTIITTVLPAVIPAGLDGIRAAVNYFAGGKQKEPANFSEQLQLMEMDIKRMTALGELDNHKNKDMPWWVDAIKTLQRPFFGATLTSAYITGVAIHAHPATLAELAQFVSMFGFYLFGERAYLNLKKAA